MQEVIPADPDTDHVTPPVGAAAPAVPVTVAVNVKVEFKDPPPEPVNTTVGITCGMTTVTGDDGDNELKLLSPV